MRQIYVSDEVYRRIEALARPFEDKEPNDVLERLLAPSADRSSIGAPEVPADKRDLVSHAGRLPHGTHLFAKYKGHEFVAQVADGRVMWKGQSFDSLSSAAVAAIRSTGSKRPTENGWRFWTMVDNEAPSGFSNPIDIRS